MTEQIENEQCTTCESVKEKRCYTCAHYLEMDYCREVCKRKDRYSPAHDRCPECGKEWGK